MISTLETSMIFIVRIPNSVVSSMFLQRIINDWPMDQQWQINDSDVNTPKTMKIKKVAIEIFSIRKTSLQRIISDRPGSSNETSMLRRLGQWKHLWWLLFAWKPLLKRQCFFGGSSTNRQRTSIEKSMIQWLTHQKQKNSKNFSTKLSMFQIRLSKGSSTIIGKAAMKHQCFGD